MKFFLLFTILFLFLSSCAKHVGVHNKDDSSLFTSSFETKTGGSISDHILFGKNSIELINIATLRCKKISIKHKVKDFGNPSKYSFINFSKKIKDQPTYHFMI